MSFRELIREYLEVCEYNQRPKWVNRKRRFLFDLITFFPAEIVDIKSNHVIAWLQKRKGVSPRTLNQELSIIRALLNYAVVQQRIQINPAKYVKMLPIEHSEPLIYSYGELQRMLSFADGDDLDYLLLLVNTLARVSEINHLTWQDINFDEGVIWLGRKDSSTKPRRSLPMNDVVREILKRRSQKSGPLVVFGFSDKRKMLKNLCKEAGVEYRGFHAIRRGMATHLVSKNTHIKQIADILGHRSLTNTRYYLRKSNEAIKEVLNSI